MFVVNADFGSKLCKCFCRDADLAGEAVRVEGQLTGPHDQIRRRDRLEAASALTASEHPDETKKVRETETETRPEETFNVWDC